LADWIEQDYTLGGCPVNVIEVYAGLRPSEELLTRRFLDSLEFFPVTAAIAAQAGLLRRDWRQRGHTLSDTDVTIAAVALANGLALLTENRKHFPMPERNLVPLPQTT
jgi:predicted nucleic acid-binding protein